MHASDSRGPLRILVINWQDRLNPQAGGAEVHLHEIFQRLVDRGHQVSLLVSGWDGAPGDAMLDGMRVRRTGKRYSFPLRVRRSFAGLAADGFDVVVEDINKLPLFTPLWVRLPVLALVPHLFGTTAFREAPWPVAATVWAAERAMPGVYRSVPVLAISESTANDLVRRGFSRDRVRVSYPGIDHQVFRPVAAVERFEEPVMVYVGRLKRYKGLDVVIRALPELRERGIAARFLIAGQGDDRRRLEQIAAEAGVADDVEFLGFVSETRKVELLRRAWVNVYPSPKEGWGITNIEAAACGTPTVASDSPGLRESVAEGESGFLAAHSDSRAWADRLGRILQYTEQRERLAKGAVRHASRFSWETAAAETEQSLIEVCRSRGGS